MRGVRLHGLNVSHGAMSLFGGVSILELQDIQTPDGDTIIIEFSEPLDENSVPDPGDFQVVNGSNSEVLTPVSVDIVGNTVVITLNDSNSGLNITDDIQVGYTPGTTPLQTEDGTPVTGFPVSPPGTPIPPANPTVNEIYTYGTNGVSIVLVLDGIILDQITSNPSPSDFVVTIDGTPVTVTTVIVAGNSITVVITGGDVTSGDVEISYAGGTIYTSQGVVVPAIPLSPADGGNWSAGAGGVLSRLHADITPALITAVEDVFTGLSTTAAKLDVFNLYHFTGAKNQHDGLMNWMKDDYHTTLLGSQISWVKGTGIVRAAVSGQGLAIIDWRSSTDAVAFGLNNGGGFREGSFGGRWATTPPTAIFSAIDNDNNSTVGRYNFTYVVATTYWGYAIDTTNNNTGNGSQANPPPAGFKMVNAVQVTTNLAKSVYAAATTTVAQVGSTTNASNGDVIVDELNRIAMGNTGGSSSQGWTGEGVFIGGGMDSGDRTRLATVLNNT